MSEVKAGEMLEMAARHLSDRAAERDTDQERSMAACVNAFNAMFGKDLTEEQGWLFMVLLKMSRAKAGRFRQDDYEDGAAYFALAGETAAVERIRPGAIQEVSFGESLDNLNNQLSMRPKK